MCKLPFHLKLNKHYIIKIRQIILKNNLLFLLIFLFFTILYSVFTGLLQRTGAVKHSEERGRRLGEASCALALFAVIQLDA